TQSSPVAPSSRASASSGAFSPRNTAYPLHEPRLEYDRLSGAGLSRVALGLQDPQNHHRVPEPFGEQSIDAFQVRAEVHQPTGTLAGGRRPSCQCATERLRMHAELGGDVALVDVLVTKVVATPRHRPSLVLGIAGAVQVVLALDD